MESEDSKPILAEILKKQENVSKSPRWLNILLLCVVAAVSILLLVFREQVRQLSAFGYPGVFLLAMLNSAPVLIPGPGGLITSAMGAILNPMWVALAAGVGAGLGEITAYFVGISGRMIVEKIEWRVKLEKWIKKNGDWTIFLLAAIPNPVFDLAGITAGILRMPLWRYILFVCAGNIIKMFVFSYGGALVSWLFGW